MKGAHLKVVPTQFNGSKDETRKNIIPSGLRTYKPLLDCWETCLALAYMETVIGLYCLNINTSINMGSGFDEVEVSAIGKQV